MKAKFGHIVHEARTERGLTLEAVANKIGTHKGYVSGIERSKVKPPSASVTMRLCKALRLDCRYMVTLGWFEKRPKSIALSDLAALLAKEGVDPERGGFSMVTVQEPLDAAPKVPPVGLHARATKAVGNINRRNKGRK